MVSEARKKALLDAFAFTGEHAIGQSGLTLWIFTRGDREYSLWLLREGGVEVNRRSPDRQFRAYDHVALGRLLFDSLPPEEIAWVTAQRLLKTRQS